MLGKSAKIYQCNSVMISGEMILNSIRKSPSNNRKLLMSCLRMSSSSAAPSQVPASEENSEDENKKRITDYSKYISKKSALREPSITRTLTKLTYKMMGTKLISLGEGMPNEILFPFKGIEVDVKDGHHISLKDSELAFALQYIPSQGLPKLVKILKDFQLRFHNPPDWNQKDVIITSGSQDGLYKSIEMLIDRGDPVIIPTPLYSGADIIVKPHEIKLLPVKQDRLGMMPSSLLEVLKRCRQQSHMMPRVMYVNPTGNNPTGTVIPNSRRKELYDIACEYDLIILEDDPYHFLSFTEEEPMSFISFDVEGRVLRFDSLSKILSSGMRVGWVTGPSQLIQNIELHMQASYLHSPTLTQMIVAKLLESWGVEGFRSHLAEVKEYYLSKRDMLLRSMEKHLKGLAEWDIPEAGMFVWIRVNNVPDVYNLIVNKALAKGITFAPGHAFSVGNGQPCPYIRATYSRASGEDMETAIATLAELIREEQKEFESFVPIQ